MPLTATELGRWARECYELAKRLLGGTADFEDDARVALAQLKDDLTVRSNHPFAVALIEKALTVDLKDAANRKGDLPAALGLVGRRSKAALIKYVAVRHMVDRLQDYSEENERGESPLPYGRPFQAAEAVVEGFYEAGIDTELTANYVLKMLDDEGIEQVLLKVLLDRMDQRTKRLHETARNSTIAAKAVKPRLH